MSSTSVKHLDPTQVELEIEIAPAEIDAAQERAFRQLVKNVRIPGFRPGKAPRKVFEAQYGSEAIAERAMEAVVPEAYSRALAENDLDPVDQPQMEMLPQEDGQPVRLRATVSVRPAIELKDYKGIELEGTAVTIGEADVENALEGLRRESATLVPVDRPVALGDVPTLDYEGKIDGVPFEGGKAEGQPVELIAERFIPGFAEGIAGMKAGESKDVEASFPEDYSNKELAGKTAVFHVTVHENKAAELPALDDEFAKRFGGPEATLDGLRADLRARLEANAQTQSRRLLTGRLMDALLERHDFALPAVLVDRETEHLEGEARSQIERSGLTWDAYLEQQGKSADDVRAEFRSEAERRVKSSLLLEAIGKAEGIEATRADVDAEVDSLARQYGQPREAILQMLSRNVGALVDGIVRTKTLEFVFSNARVTEPSS